MMDPLIDVAFELLETATRLEKDGSNRVEAATKYFESVYLMKEVLQRTPQTHQFASVRNLLEEKIEFYSVAASKLYFDDMSTAQTIVSNPRSPTMGQQKFFTGGSKVVSSQSAVTCGSITQTAELNRKAGQANTKLSLAMDLDESGENTDAIIEAYTTAAKLYLNTIRLSEAAAASSIAAVLKRRLEGALDRIEQLKKEPKSRFKQEPTIRKEPKEQSNTISKSSYTEHEILVLKNSSLIASGFFLPWSDEDAQRLSLQTGRAASSPPLFSDNQLLKLSEKQEKVFHKWARPSEIIVIRESFGKKQQPPIMIQSVNQYSIRQQYVTDCSFVASLCICAAFEKRFRRRLVTPIIYPQNKDGVPIYNPSGKYIVKLWLNGVARQVVVDDRLPIDAHGRLLCSNTKTSNHRLELWVSIIEKAYMKLCGGYDFPGSNSGVDLFSLTGWIPERIFFPKNPDKTRDFETEPERAWERLFSANSFGDCLITVSTTHDLEEAQAERLGLITGHAYAVLDVVQASDGTRLLQMKNPWASKGWQGKFSSHDSISWQNSVLRSEIGYNAELAAEHDDGIFWISWGDVLRYFQNLQLSWNPALFSCTVTTHDFWPVSQGPKNDTFNIGENPQYVLQLSEAAVRKKATVWILISRHVTKQEQDGSEVNDFLTIHLMRNSKEKERVWYPHGPDTLIHGAYTNNPHVLVRYDVSSPKDQFISLVLSQHNKSQDMSYTLSCYCTESFSLGRPGKELRYVKDIPGQWTATNASGPVGKANFFFNPMYVVTLPKEATLHLRCSTMKSFAVNVMLVNLQKVDSNDIRSMARTYGKITLDSGNYRHGFAVTERKKVPPGTYTIIVSTFNPGQTGIYTIKIASSVAIEARAVA